jgi:hypothetical protein
MGDTKLAAIARDLVETLRRDDATTLVLRQMEPSPTNGPPMPLCEMSPGELVATPSSKTRDQGEA